MATMVGPTITASKFDYATTDTGRLSEFSDRELLELTKAFFSNGEGPIKVVAEICKRFEKTICDDDISIGLCSHGQTWDDCPVCCHQEDQ